MVQLRKDNKVVKNTDTKKSKKATVKDIKKIVQTFVADDLDIETVMFMPQTESERKSFINPKTKRHITPFQYRVYDYCAQIPKGHVTSYKELSDALHSAPRAVGQALKLNPFAPLPVPCHRVIAANRNIGGFSGGFGDCQLVTNKKAKLMREGCVFDKNYNFINNVDKSAAMFNEFK